MLWHLPLLTSAVFPSDSQVRDMFYFDYNNLLGQEELSHLPAVATAISIAPVKTTVQFYRLHHYVLELSIEEHQQRLHHIRREFVATSEHLRYNNRYEARRWPWLKLSAIKSKEDLIVWHYLNATHLCLVGAHQPMSLLTQYQKAALQKVMEFAIAEMNHKRAWGLRYLQKNTVYDGFVQHDPLMGDEYMLRVIMTKPSDEQEQVYMNVVVPLEEPGALIWHPWGDPWESVKVDMVVPIAPRDTSACLVFLDNFQREAIEKGLPVVLHLIVSKLMETSHVSSIQQRVDAILEKHPSAHIIVHTANISDSDEACKYGAGLLQVDKLMIFMSIHITFFQEFLIHAVTLTLRGHQVYLPVPFQFYHASLLPSNSPHVVSQETGFWDTQNFEVVAMYIQDYEALGQFGPRDRVVQKLVSEAALSKVRGLEPYLRIDYEGNPQCRSTSNAAEASLESPQGCSVPLGSRQYLSALARKHKLVT